MKLGIGDTRYKIRALDTLSAKEKSFLHWYIKVKTKKEAAVRAGYPTSRASAIATNILKKKNAEYYIKNVMASVERKLNWEFTDKLSKLKKVADLAIPDEATSMEDICHQAGIAAIAESNKMQGHYSAEKVVNTNVNVDVDLQQVHDLLEQYKREY